MAEVDNALIHASLFVIVIGVSLSCVGAFIVRQCVALYERGTTWMHVLEETKQNRQKNSLSFFSY